MSSTPPVGFKDYLYDSPNWDATQAFKEMSGWHQAATVIVTFISGILLFYPGYIAFRALTHTFRQIEKEELAKKQTTSKTQRVVSESGVITPPPEPTVVISSATDKNAGSESESESEKFTPPPTNVTPPQTHSSKSTSSEEDFVPLPDSDDEDDFDKIKHEFKEFDWQGLWQNGLTQHLAQSDKVFKKAEEQGDCLFDAVAQTLTQLKGENFTKKDIRQAIAKHLNDIFRDKPELMEIYKEKYRINCAVSYDYTFKEYLKNIGKCAEDFPKFVQGDPGASAKENKIIWGDRFALQIISEIFKVNIEYINCNIEEFEENDLQFQQENPPFSIEGRNGYREATEFIMEEPIELPKETPSIGTIELAAISRGTWGHWVPVFKKD